MRSALYRFFDDRDCLLYVGKSNNPFDRLTRHMRKKPNMGQVVHIEIEWFASEADALEAETIAIRVERPLWNKRDRRQPRDRRSTVDTVLPVIVPPRWYGPPTPDRICRLRSDPDMRFLEYSDWKRALRVCRDGDIVQVEDVDIPKEFYIQAMAQEVFVLHV